MLEGNAVCSAEKLQRFTGTWLCACSSRLSCEWRLATLRFGRLCCVLSLVQCLLAVAVDVHVRVERGAGCHAGWRPKHGPFLDKIRLYAAAAKASKADGKH